MTWILLSRNLLSRRGEKTYIQTTKTECDYTVKGGKSKFFASPGLWLKIDLSQYPMHLGHCQNLEKAEVETCARELVATGGLDDKEGIS